MIEIDNGFDSLQSSVARRLIDEETPECLFLELVLVAEARSGFVHGRALVFTLGSPIESMRERAVVSALHESILEFVDAESVTRVSGGDSFRDGKPRRTQRTTWTLQCFNRDTDWKAGARISLIQTESPEKTTGIGFGRTPNSGVNPL